MSQRVGWGTITAFAIPIVSVTCNGSADRELMLQVKDALEHCGYDVRVVENASEAIGEYLLLCEVRRFNFRNYTYFFPLVLNWGNIQLDLIVNNPDGNLAYFNSYTARANGFYSFDKTVNLALTRLLDKVILDLSRIDFRSPPTPICPLLLSEDTGEIKRCLRALRRLNASPAVPEVLTLLQHEEVDVIRDACRTLAALGSPELISTLEPLLKHQHPAVRKDTESAIVKLRAKSPQQPERRTP